MKSVLRFLAAPLFFLILCVSLTGCGGGDGDGGGGSTPASVPAIPTGITATAGNAKVTVSWNSSTGATSYNIYYATSPGVTKAGAKVANATSPYDVTGLTNDTTYYFVVTAVNSAGESEESSENSATPSAGLQPPASPNGVTTTAGTGQVTIQWNTKLTATSYNIYYSSTITTSAGLLSGGTKISVPAASADPQPATQSYVKTGLTAGTTYYFVVTSVNAAGESGAQNFPKTATPL